jgi:hypothetical protein
MEENETKRYRHTIETYMRLARWSAAENGKPLEASRPKGKGGGLNEKS